MTPNIMNYKESEKVELKTSLSEWKEIVKTVSAFSNTLGSTIFVGVDNNRNLVGIEIGKKTIVGKKVYWDGQICKDANLKEIDTTKLENFLRRARTERNLKLDSNIPLQESLEKLNLLKDAKLTNASILLFGKEPQKFFSQSEVRCACFEGTKPIIFIDMIWNPGNLPEGLTIDMLKKSHLSIPRNKQIVDSFFLIKHIEKWETGTNKMIDECIKEGLPESEFQENSLSFIIIFRKYIITEDIIIEDKLRELNMRKQNAIKYIIKNKNNKMGHKWVKKSHRSSNQVKNSLINLEGNL